MSHDTFRRYVQQQAQAEEAALERVVRLRELAVKHGVTLSSPIHDEVIVEGEPEAVKAFTEEYMKLSAGDA